MKTYLLAIGKLRPHFRAACDDYLRRLRHYGPMEERELREAGRVAGPEARKREETTRLAGAVPDGATRVLLDRRGDPWSSEEVARRLDRWRQEAATPVLLIGGAFGVDPEGLGVVRHRWSLGPLTLPHELARVVVLEQWYRAWTILRGEPYHKGGTA